MKTLPKLTFTAATFLLLMLAACGKRDDQGARLENETPSEAAQRHTAQLAEIAKLYPEAVSTESGLHYVVELEGRGETPQRGQMVTAHYHGTLLNGETFDSSRQRGRPFSFPVGMGRVIKGWDEAFLDMKKGEKRKLILPSQIAYGARASGPIGPHSVLVFDVELLDFK